MPGRSSGSFTTADEERSLQAINEMFAERVQSGQFDDLTIRDVRVKAAQETEQLLANDSQASIVTIIAFIVFT